MNAENIAIMVAEIEEYIYQKKGVHVKVIPNLPMEFSLLLQAHAVASEYLNNNKNKAT